MMIWNSLEDAWETHALLAWLFGSACIHQAITAPSCIRSSGVGDVEENMFT
jgi:hypothetical protein